MTIFRHRVTGPGSAGDTWVCTLHSEGNVTLQQANLAWGNFVGGALQTTLADWWAPTTQVTSIITDQLDPVTWKNVAQIAEAYELVGTDAGKPPSPRSCLVVGFRTSLPTRSGRGRMYLPSPSANHYNAQGKFIQAEMDTIALDVANALTVMKAEVTPVIAHRSTKTTTPITRVTVGDIPGTQRRRTNKDVQNYASRGI